MAGLESLDRLPSSADLPNDISLMVLRSLGDVKQDDGVNDIFRRSLETLLRTVTPSSWWFPMRTLTPSAAATLLNECKSQPAFPCDVIHPNHCIVDDILSAQRMLRRSWKLYLFVHLIPHLLFKKDKFSRRALFKLAMGYLRTLCYYVAYAFAFRFCWCYGKELFGSINPRNTVWMAGASCGLALMIERSSRWPEYGMNFLPRFLESLPRYLKKQDINLLDIPLGINLLMAISMGLIAYVHFGEDPGAVKIQFQFLVRLLLGRGDFDSKSSKVSAPPKSAATEH